MFASAGAASRLLGVTGLLVASGAGQGASAQARSASTDASPATASTAAVTELATYGSIVGVIAGAHLAARDGVPDSGLLVLSLGAGGLVPPVTIAVIGLHEPIAQSVAVAGSMGMAVGFLSGLLVAGAFPEWLRVCSTGATRVGPCEVSPARSFDLVLGATGIGFAAGLVLGGVARPREGDTRAVASAAVAGAWFGGLLGWAQGRLDPEPWRVSLAGAALSAVAMSALAAVVDFDELDVAIVDGSFATGAALGLAAAGDLAGNDVAGTLVVGSAVGLGAGVLIAALRPRALDTIPGPAPPRIRASVAPSMVGVTATLEVVM